MRRHPCYLAILSLMLASCGNQGVRTAPERITPLGAKVDLNMVSIQVENAVMGQANDGNYRLSFDYIIENQAGAVIVFPCLYNNTDELIEVNLTDSTNQILLLGKRPLEGLTLTEPQPLRIPMGKTKRNYQVPVVSAPLNQEDPLRMRVRLHAPSRYDELRSSIEATGINLQWP